MEPACTDPNDRKDAHDVTREATGNRLRALLYIVDDTKDLGYLTRRPLALALSALALGVIAWVTLTSSSLDRPAPPAWCFLCAEVHGTDVLLNILLFIPLGIALRLAGASLRRVLAISALVTLAVEVAQWLFVSGRVASFADIVANVLGAAIGMLLAERGYKLVFPGTAVARVLAMVSVLGWLAVQGLTVWAFAPSLNASTFWMQIAANLGHMDLFRGRVTEAKIGGVDVPNGRMEDDRHFRQLLATGSSIQALVIPGEPPARLAPIVSIFTGKQSEILVLGQEGRDLVFRMRTHSSNVRLRTPTVSLWNAFPPPAAAEVEHPADPLLVSGWRSGWRLHVSVAGRDTSFARSIALRPSFGWALMLPFEHTGMPIAWRYTAVWMAVLLFPAGYWGAHSVIPVRAEREGRLALKAAFRVLTFLGFAALVLAAGLIALPFRLKLPAAGVWEWGGALAGIALGGLTGSLSSWLRHSRLRRSPE